MAKVKKSTEIESLWKAFHESYDDNELQVRYNGFQKNLESFKKQYNEMVPNINSALEDQTILRNQIIDSAKMSFLNTDSIKRLKVVETYLSENLPQIEDLKEKMSREENLIKKYEESSHSRLFNWWQALRSIDSSITPWMEWRTKYDKKIF